MKNLLKFKIEESKVCEIKGGACCPNTVDPNMNYQRTTFASLFKKTNQDSITTFIIYFAANRGKFKF